MGSSSLAANIPLLDLSSHLEEAGIDANSFAVSTLAVLCSHSFTGVPGITPVTTSLICTKLFYPMGANLEGPASRFSQGER